ncbi:MAG: Crp/Fnr family transcriptional regulator [Coriobacteriia bacterium]|nr:Crp/Fnr family transcriptional regulator [Coriobacteriia bacterium]
MGASDDIRPDVYAALRACRLWLAASNEAVEKLARRATVREVTRGTTLAREGEAAEEFGVLISGKARVYYLGADGRQITFETVESGEPLAAVAALAGARYPANIDAATPATIATLPTEALFEMLADEPQVARSLVVNLSNRVVNFTSVVSTLALDVPGRVARFVFQRSLQAGRATPNGLEVGLGMKKGELAMALGTVPETLSRAFAKLRDDGIMDVSGQTVTVLDMRALAALASGYDEN